MYIHWYLQHQFLFVHTEVYVHKLASRPGMHSLGPGLCDSLPLSLCIISDVYVYHIWARFDSEALRNEDV